MKNAVKSILSIFLVVAILGTTAGITVYPHFCKEEGDVTLRFYKKENCCDEKTHHLVKKENHGCCKKSIVKNENDKGCCKQEAFTAQWKIDSFSFQKQIDFSAPSLSLFVLFDFDYLFSTFQNNFISFTDTSPPYIESGKEILHKISILRI